MTDIEELKQAILEIEKEAHDYEPIVAYWSVRNTAWADRAAKIEKKYRIAASCMWEKLERLEKEAGQC